MTEMREPKLLNPTDAAKYLGLGSRWAIYRLVHRGELRAARILGKIRIDRDDLEALVADRKDAIAPTARSGRPGATSIPNRLTPRGRIRRSDNRSDTIAHKTKSAR